MITRRTAARKSPNLPTRDEVKATMARVLGALDAPSETWVSEAKHWLRAIRSGVAGHGVSVQGVRLLERVTYDEAGNAYYHLTSRTRALLRANGGLPWSV